MLRGLGNVGVERVSLAILADELASPPDVRGGSVGHTGRRLPLGTSEVALGMGDDVEIASVQRIQGFVGALVIGDQGRVLEQDVVETGLGEGRAHVPSLDLQGALERILQQFGGDVEVGLALVRGVGGGETTDFLHHAERHGLGIGDVVGLPEGKVGLGDFAVSNGGVGIEQVGETDERTRTGIDGLVGGESTVNLLRHDVADRLLGIAHLRGDSLHDSGITVVHEIIVHVHGERGVVGSIREEGGRDDFLLRDRQFAGRPISTSIRHVVFEVALDFLTAAVRLAALEQLPEQNVALEIDVNRLNLGDVVVGNDLEFFGETHVLIPSL